MEKETFESRMAQRYRERVFPQLQERFAYSSPMEVPRVKKVVLNMGLGEAISNAKAIEHATYCLERIAGQRPLVTRAKKSIANFKLREGMPIGCTVTLRGQRMNSFLDRLISVALPRVRDFRGIPRKGFDGKGNYTLGIKEQVVFPEIDIDRIDGVRGMNITFVTTAKTDEEGQALLELVGLPFRKKSQPAAKAA